MKILEDTMAEDEPTPEQKHHQEQMEKACVPIIAKVIYEIVSINDEPVMGIHRSYNDDVIKDRCVEAVAVVMTSLAALMVEGVAAVKGANGEWYGRKE